MSSLADALQAQQAFFLSGRTRSLEFRVSQLQSLKQAIQRYEGRLLDALKVDLGKASFEAYATEIGFTLDEIRHTLKHLSDWMATTDVKTPLVHQPAQSQLIYEPKGVVLIISPWNYPFQLLFSPLVGALAAGNCALLKPSELTPATSAVMAELVQRTFDNNYVALVEGGVETTQALLDLPVDHVFFTGSTRVGRIVMEKAAKHLTPVTLELGGKSPCIVDRGVPLDVTARRIVWGKFLNAGQTCVAPDYVLCPSDMLEGLIEAFQRSLREFYGQDPHQSQDYARIVNQSHFDRLIQLLWPERVVIGGQHHREERYLAPTVMAPVSWHDPIMEDEIFGPILPVLTYESLEDAITEIQRRPRPLAFYFFSENSAHQKHVAEHISFGGGCVNDTLIHLATPYLPFGGVGSSGMGAYHGRYSFETFSHRKAWVQRPLKLDLPLRYPPYPGWKEKVVRQIMR